MACIYNDSIIIFQIICTFIKLIFVIFASVEIPVQDKMGCWNEVTMTCKKMEQLKWFISFPTIIGVL